MSKANFTLKKGGGAKLSRSLGYDAFFVNLLLARNAIIPLHPPYAKATSSVLIGCLSFVLFLFSMQSTFAEKSSAIAVLTDEQKMNHEVLPDNDCLVSWNDYDSQEYKTNRHTLQSDFNDIVLSSCLTSQNDFISYDVNIFNQINCPIILNFNADIYFFECKTDIQNEQSFLNFK